VRRLGGIVGEINIRRRLFLPLGAVKFQNRVERDFADAQLDDELLPVAVLFSYSRVRSFPTNWTCAPFFSASNKARQFSPSDRLMPVSEPEPDATIHP